ncbi:MAG: Anti-sigma regulatory factor [Caldanaerobacter subterraneus]|jgi:anti-sigma regulatory factor (Ser/Thr protein kinase)|uniref:Anti-sigma regulatory factor (Ser/Thr protein kinase) n=4 Tax=Caldanaerobacter subterraneus TaxID=911092 RepID=Q8RBD6_CALS4|nr:MULTISPECIES: ATP-binding protein [Caldanaerobacter]AAM24142.1 Anti-sigma regulatory factor (Ser/Thr protein kinase) [Caldanaerobacter subterraneus subsp. tengcongensis MB4]ERM93002.1 anti-sigma regulatory factor [Caldanaerobacter subterraneus subsp. yonseiensis KB-1]KKC30066.1 anti-sigma regulatory factor (Ser/Thr protein kinase) [Caldanaerobacter subterraneus subsp. pacificus DSM 12653]KUK09343.1 MAG: Anti-sigma regulatory factor [Caldanaerobacter subterraneus]MBE3579843.1 ATP-binding pro
MALYSKEFEVKARDFDSAGEVSSNLRAILKQLSLAPDIVRRSCIVCYEAEMNIIIHSYGGTIKIEIFEDRIRIIAEDTGPGIEDIELAMKEGYSTAPEEIREMGFGAGMGLPNIKANSDFMDIKSSKDGTVVVAEILF